MDNLSPERRSENMRRIRSQDTSPELEVRRFLHRQGLRYRLHQRDLPGKPDLVFPTIGACLFVHGCFWHGCKRCVDGTRRVKSQSRYWTKKISGNRKRDKRNVRALIKSGWSVYVVWECELRRPSRLRAIARQLMKRRRRPEARARASNGSPVIQ
jgi:DNA mismatch endonuclease (patch repair protein)